MKTGSQGIELITFYEGIRLEPYLCPANKVTIGIGKVLLDKDGNMLQGKDGLLKSKDLYPEYQKITKDIAIADLKKDLEHYEKSINSLKIDLKQNEFDALVSFIYNLGFGALQQSTLLKRINTREGDIEAAFMMWVKAGGKTLPGLVKRRKAEATLFLTNKLSL